MISDPVEVARLHAAMLLAAQKTRAAELAMDATPPARPGTSSRRSGETLQRQRSGGTRPPRRDDAAQALQAERATSPDGRRGCRVLAPERLLALDHPRSILSARSPSATVGA
jgi:hypothetical protein